MALQAICIELGKSNRVALCLLSDMPSVLKEVGLTRVPHYTALHTWFIRIPTKRSRSFFGITAGKRTDHAAIDFAGFDGDRPSCHYANRTTTFRTLYSTVINLTTSKKHNARIGPQVAC